ncbi:MAG: hypothetical protein WCA35_02185, partial [Kovacikia sp.]
NDISLIAGQVEGSVYFNLHLSMGERGDAPQPVGVLIKPEVSLEVLAALAEVYRDYTRQQTDSMRPKPRLRQFLDDWGVEDYLQAVASRLPFPLERREIAFDSSSAHSYGHLSVHPQRQPDFSYIGVVLPLGRLEAQQLRGLAALAAQSGNSTLRLTPWQNLLITDIPNQRLADVQQSIKQLGLQTSALHPWGAIVACSGTTGCKSSASDTQSHALQLATYVEQQMEPDRPINIHLSGCKKSCAQHHPSDIALLGMLREGGEAYQVFVGGRGSKFGRNLSQEYSVEQLPGLIEHLLKIYQNQRKSSDETFREFVDRQPPSRLDQLLAQPLDDSHPNP